MSPQHLRMPGGSWEMSRNAREVPQGVQKLLSCQCSSKISCRDENHRPSNFKRPGGPGRGPEMPWGSLGGSSTIQVTSSTSSLVHNADARNLASPGSLHRYIANKQASGEGNLRIMMHTAPWGYALFLCIRI